VTELLVYYDFASPFCYAEVEIAERLRARFSLRVSWCPFEVIDYLPERGAWPQNPAFVRRAEAASVARLAREYNLTIRIPERLLNSNLALSAVEFARGSVPDGGDDQTVADSLRISLFEAQYRDGRDISDLATVLEIARSRGVAGNVEEALRGGLYRQHVAESRVTAHALGVVAVPTWIAGGYGAVGVPAFSELVRLLETASSGDGS
jgi:predicted DsbA family dithiol-disulfide isomerase